MIPWELCKKLKFDHNKWYVHELESIQENETQKILWNFEVQTDHLILVRRLDVLIVNKKEKKKKKKTCRIVDLAVPENHGGKIKKSEKRDPAIELKCYETWRWRWYQF